MLSRYKLRNYNFRLIIFLVFTSVIGVLLVGSAESSLMLKQGLGLVAGVFLMLFMSVIDYSWILNFYWVLYVFNLGMLGILYTGLFDSKFGATRWIDFGFFQFQPTELSKIILILVFAAHLQKHEKDLNTPKTILQTVGILIPPLILIYEQPDLKNTITVFVVFCIMLYVAGISYKLIAGILAVVLPLILAIFLLLTQFQYLIPDFLKDSMGYQLDRIDTWLNPEDEDNAESYIQQKNSITAIGSGELTGKGLNNNLVSSANKGNFVSQIHNDFIFAVAGEELGFIGSVLIILLFALIILECVRIALRAKDLAGQIICCGMAGLIAFQSFLNISVATGLMPNTGTPLPFISYGLTSLFTLYIGMGFVLNVGLQNRDFVTKNLELRRRKKFDEHRLYRS